MKESLRVGITDDTNIMRCRLIIRLIEICGAVPVLIPTNLGQDVPGLKHIKKSQVDELLDPHLKVVEDVLDSCDALIFPGNKRDIHPSLYGSDFIHPQTERRLPKNPLNARQITELKMIEYAFKKRNLPILGICGGMQLINAAMGGNLVQHLPDDSRTDNSERENYHYDDNLKNLSAEEVEDFEENYISILDGQKTNIYKGTHSMQVYKTSILADIYQKAKPDIDLSDITELSIHHQGCFAENLASNLKITAIAPDGVVEAAEHKNYPKMFLLTQFHPECNASGIALEMVKSLIESAKN